MSPRAGTVVRAATREDAAAIARIYNQGIQERIATFETEPRTPADIEHLLEERAGRYPTMVVERGGEVVAWASAGSYRARPCYDAVAEHSVYVDRVHRGTGVGRLALEALVADVQRHGFLKLVGRIFPENEPSLALHRQVGFREVGSIAGTANWTASGETSSSLRSCWAKRPRPRRDQQGRRASPAGLQLSGRSGVGPQIGATGNGQRPGGPAPGRWPPRPGNSLYENDRF